MTENPHSGTAQKIYVISPSLARLIIVLSFAVSFAIPYFAFVVKDYYEDRAWIATGLHGYEIDDWKQQKISTAMAVRWRNAGFNAPHASIWIRYGFSPEDAGQWNRNGFWPSDAQYWIKYGFTVREAIAWKASGFYYTEAKDWKDGGVTPEDAAKRRKKGEWPPPKKR
jgi:hypothetical protein